MLSLGDQSVIVPPHKAQPTRKARISPDKATQTLSNVHGKACETFFKRHTVFTAEAFHAHLAVHGTKPSAQQCIRILREYVEAGRLHPLRLGAYLTRTAARSLDQEPVTNLIQIAAHMTPDAVLAYHTALECYGLAYSVWFHALYAARNPANPLRLATGLVRGTPFPQTLKTARIEHLETALTPKNGLRITTVERTLVDIADRPHLGGDWSEVARGYGNAASVVHFGRPLPDVQRMVAYALRLDHAFTCAKVGFLLDLYKTEWDLDSALLQPLIKACPRQARPLDPRYTDMPASLVTPWNLIAPLWVQQRTWEDY